MEETTCTNGVGGNEQQDNDPGAPPGPCGEYMHDHPPVRNVNVEFDRRLRLGQVVADRVAAAVGSWPFILIQSALLLMWMAANAYLAYLAHFNQNALKAWDPYPFILLNLVLSFQAAYTGPIVMMSQNRQSDKDRLSAQQDFEVNLKAEQEIGVLMRHLVFQDEQLREMTRQLARLQAKLDTLTPVDAAKKG